MNEIVKAIEKLKSLKGICLYAEEGQQPPLAAREIAKVYELAITSLEQQADRWIPVTEQPPEVKDGEWAVFIVPSHFGIGNNRITSRYFKEQGIKHEDGWTDKRVEKATHWMPLPEQWKEEQL